MQANFQYNRYGDHDPEGMLFVPLAQADLIRDGAERPVPLILRVNAGDWVEVTLHNLFDRPVVQNFYPSVPVDLPHVPSNRVSLNPQFLQYDPVYSSGLNVGRNAVEQTAGPGECIKYLWHADREYGPCLLTSFGDLRNHRHHGLFGAVIVEPVGSKYYSGIRPCEENHLEQAVITAPGQERFREFVLFAQNGIRLLDREGNLIKTTEQGEGGAHGGVDHEDTGEKGYNYRSERFFNRLEQIPLISKIFDPKVHGDPATPLLYAYAGERVRIRYLMPGDKPRNISFALHGHQWRPQPEDSLSGLVPIQGAISVGGVYDIQLDGNASVTPGDYLYCFGSLRWDVESGMWGILRVMSRSLRYYCAEAYGKAAQWWRKWWCAK